MIQLTDGTVMVQQIKTRNWWRLTPDSSGSYVDGTWSKLGALPSGYAPEYYASAVLPDGRVIIEGGEDNYATTGDTPTNKGAIYNPTTNKWVSVKPPSGWTSIGDAQSVVLANGQFMLAQASQEIGGKYGCAGSNAALLNATSLKWTSHGRRQELRRWLPLRRARLDPTTRRSGADRGYLAYHPHRGDRGLHPVHRLVDERWQHPGPPGGQQLRNGPGRPPAHGTVLAEGATGNNAIYNTTKRTWSAGPGSPAGSSPPTRPLRSFPTATSWLRPARPT